MSNIFKSWVEENKSKAAADKALIADTKKWDATFGKQYGLKWNKDILNQAGHSDFQQLFRAGSSADTIQKVSQLPEIQQTAAGIAADYGGHITNAQAMAIADGSGLETVFNPDGTVTGAGATAGGAAPTGMSTASWVSLGLKVLGAVIGDGSKKGQAARNPGNYQVATLPGYVGPEEDQYPTLNQW